MKMLQKDRFCLAKPVFGVLFPKVLQLHLYPTVSAAGKLEYPSSAEPVLGSDFCLIGMKSQINLHKSHKQKA
jgi:hypothetical protein